MESINFQHKDHSIPSMLISVGCEEKDLNIFQTLSEQRLDCPVGDLLCKLAATHALRLIVE